PDIFIKELELSWAHLEVLEDAASRLLGYIDYWLVHDEVHILNIAVDPVFRRCGCGRFMLDHGVERAKHHGAGYSTLEVRSRNLGAIQLYESQGYEAVGLRRGYYADTGDDAIVMALVLEAASGGSSGGPDGA